MRVWERYPHRSSLCYGLLQLGEGLGRPGVAFLIFTSLGYWYRLNVAWVACVEEGVARVELATLPPP